MKKNINRGGKMITETWKVKGLFHADPHKVAEEIRSIGDDATPAQIVELAKGKSTELHRCFEWNNTVAAEKYRLHQARQICANLIIKRPEEDAGENDVPIRVFYKTTNDEGYKDSAIIFHKEDEYAALLKRALGELHAFKMKYSSLKEISDILAMID